MSVREPAEPPHEPPQEPPQEPSRAPSGAAALIRRIAERQDRAAFAELFTAFAPRVKAFALRRGAPAPDEVAQEVMLAIWRKAASFDPARGDAEAWIFRIARNACIDALRRTRGLPLLEISDPFAPPEPTRGDAELEAAQAAARVRQALVTLSPEQREVVRLSFFDDRPHAEISALLGVPLGTVKSRLRLAMSRLRERLQELR
ncbi:MAG: sigma-70 family RNA polymerase sigma factor [Alphaproteobacteria bacterium]|nr:sigma-70 family RNA polymerase sigma factor [Alphaproteobacteria bacterium]